MNRLALNRRTRLAALVLLALLLWLAATPAAQAQSSGFRYLVAAGNHQVRYTHQSTSYLQREVRDNGGALIETITCPAPVSNCFPPLPPGAATYAVSLEGFNSAREEIVSESCGNVASTVPQQYCVDGALRMTLRVRTGAINATMSLTPVAPGQLINPGTATMRMAFTDDPTRYWELPVGGSTVAPAGSFRVTSESLRAPCQPMHTNPDAVLDVPAGGTGDVTLSFRRTLCSFYVSIHNSDTAAAGEVASPNGTLTCGDPNRLVNTCTGTFPAHTTVRFTGSAAPGYSVHFNNNPLTTHCNYPLEAPDRCDVVATWDRSVRMDAYPGVTPPPPPPPPAVTLAFAAGAATPADHTAPKGEVGVPMLQLRATPANGTAMLHALTLRASGSGRDDLDLPSLRVVLDANGNGRADTGETVLAQGRPTVDNGSMRLEFGTPLALTAATDLLVVIDIADTVNSASALGVVGGGLALAGFALWPVGYTRRRARLSLMAAVLLAAALVSGCGGGGGDDDPGAQTPPPPPGAVTVTYRLELTAVDATDDASPAQAVNVADVPITGALVTVTQ